MNKIGVFMTINPSEAGQKSIALKTTLLLVTLITATLYVYTTITPVLGKTIVPAGHYFIRIGHDSGYSPGSLTISRGASVDWSNQDQKPNCPTGQARDYAGLCWPIKECKASIFGQPGTCAGTPVTITSDTGAFDSGDIQPGGGYGHTFNTSGTYKYFDKNNAGHKGEIIVT
jgi:plastocyanin